MKTPAPEDFDFALPMKVRDYEVDCEGIVNNANYLHYFEVTRHEFCEAAGLSFAEMHAQGIDPVLRRADVEYFVPLRPGNRFVSCLSLRRQGAKFIFSQAVFREPDLTLCTRAEITVVSIRDGRLTRGEELAAVFAKYLRP